MQRGYTRSLSSYFESDVDLKEGELDEKINTATHVVSGFRRTY